MRALSKSGDIQGLKGLGALVGLLTEELGDWDWRPKTRSVSFSGAIEIESSFESEVRSHTEKLVLAKLRERQQAREQKDFARADEIRDQLVSAGVEVVDSPSGPEWSLLPSFDPSKLEALK